jgi:hypothetical protein
MSVRRTAGVVSATVALSLAAFAQTPVGPVVTLAPSGTDADVAIDGAGQSVVVWRGADGDQTGIFARRLDALGNPVGEAFRVNESTTGGQSAPTVATGPGGEFVVLWTSQVGSVTHAVFRRFDAAGIPQGGEVQADVDPAQEVLPRSVAIDPTGAFLVVWDTRPGLGVSDVLARRFDAAGNALGAPFRVSSGTAGNPGAAAAAPLRDGGFIVAWNRDMARHPTSGSVNENGKLAARAFDAAGQPRGDEFAVRPETDPLIPVRAQVTAEADGGFLVTWAYGVGTHSASRAGRSFDASLAPREAEFQVAAKTWSNAGDEYETIEQVAAGPPGGFVVVADRYTYDYEGYYINQQVNARRINAAGTLLEPEFVVAPEYPSDGPRVAANAAGFIVVWSLNGNVRARRVHWDQNTGRITGHVIDGASGLPLPDADVRVGRFNDHTDATGAYSILLTAGSHFAAVELHGYASDTVPVVVTAGDEITQDFVLRRIPVLRVAGTTVDDTTGNANGVADLNECFGLRIELSNIGAGDATAVSATLTTTTPQVTVQQGGTAYPDLPPGAAAANQVAFRIKTSPTFVPGTTIQLTLTVATAQGPFTLPVSVPTATAVKRQAFDSSGPVRVENIWAPGGRSSVSIPVTGVQGVITRVQVRIHATRGVRGTMRLSLFGPDTPWLGDKETRLALFHTPSDGFGTDCPADSNDLTFQDDAASSFQSAPPPHVGEFRPWDPLAHFAGKSGAAANGMWTIVASDMSDDRSVIECARILITYHAARTGECEEVAIAGTVTRADTGAPVAGASVRTDTAFQTVSDANGRYRLAVTPGPHQIEVQADGYSPGSATVTAVAGSTVNADITLVPMVLAVASVVVDDTGPGGNGNGRVDFDEAFRLSVRLSNTGSAASNVFAALWPMSGGVVVARPLSGYPSLPAGGSGTNTPPFELRTTSSLRTGEPVLLGLTLVGPGTVIVPVSLETGTPSGLPPAAFTGTDVVNVSGLAGPVAKVVAQTYVEANPSYSTELTLTAPGTSVRLLENTWSNTPANFGTSCPADDDDLTFDDDAEVFIREAYWPWRGRFRPLQPLSAFTGKPGNNEWRFRAENLWENARVVCSRLLIDTFASAGADASDLIFRDGFDTPAPFAPWSEVTDDPDLTATAAARVRPTPRGLQATVNDRTGLFVRHDTPDGENRYRARFHFDPNGFDPGEAGGKHRAMIFLAFADAPQKRLVQVVLRRLGGVYSLRGVVRVDDDTLVETPFVEITDAPHVIELDWRRATDPAARDGWFELWVDGGSAGRLDGLDNDLRAVDFVRLGAMTLKDGATGTLYFDQFEARRVLPIGPYVP